MEEPLHVVVCLAHSVIDSTVLFQCEMLWHITAVIERWSLRLVQSAHLIICLMLTLWPGCCPLLEAFNGELPLSHCRDPAHGSASLIYSLLRLACLQIVNISRQFVVNLALQYYHNNKAVSYCVSWYNATEAIFQNVICCTCLYWMPWGRPCTDIVQYCCVSTDWQIVPLALFDNSVRTESHCRFVLVYIVNCWFGTWAKWTLCLLLAMILSTCWFEVH